MPWQKPLALCLLLPQPFEWISERVVQDSKWKYRSIASKTTRRRNRRDVHNRESRVSKGAPTVFEVFFAPETSVDEQHALEQQFFDQVVLPNGTFKTTYPSRFDNINEAFLPHIATLANRPIKIMDVGASSGISTSEWYTYLSRSGIDCDITGSDRTIYVWLVTFRFTSKVAALVDRDGKIIHFDLFGVGYRRQPIRKLLRLNTLRTLAVSALLRAAMVLDGGSLWARAGLTTSHQRFMLKYQPIALLSRSFADNCRLRMIEDDLLAEKDSTLCQAFDVIRAGNILNLIYFPVDQIRRILTTLKRRLKEGGLLIIVRTDPNGENNGSIFRLAGDQFLVVDRFGKGSEIEPIVIGR